MNGGYRARKRAISSTFTFRAIYQIDGQVRPSPYPIRLLRPHQIGKQTGPGRVGRHDDRLAPGPLRHDPVYWALDLETGGLDPRYHDVVSVGMVPIRGGRIRVGESFYSLVKPLRAMTEQSITIHHLDPADLAGAPALEDVLPSIVARLGEGVLLVHCAMVDVPFLRRACARAGVAWPRPLVVDTMRLLARLARRADSEPRPPVALAAARAHFGLPPHRSHHALSDAMATAELFLMLVHRLKARRLHGLL